MGAISIARDAGSTPAVASPADYSLICFSHQRWDCVFQRRQHVMRRFAREHRVIFWEEPVSGDSPEATIDVRTCPHTGVVVVTPRLPDLALAGMAGQPDQIAVLRTLLEIFLAGQKGPLVRWYCTPMMLPFSRQIEAACTVYDCRDELANFRLAPQLLELERELLELAEIVLTGGDGRCEARKNVRDGGRTAPAGVDIDRLIEDAVASCDPGPPGELMTSAGAETAWSVAAE